MFYPCFCFFFFGKWSKGVFCGLKLFFIVIWISYHFLFIFRWRMKQLEEKVSFLHLLLHSSFLTNHIVPMKIIWGEYEVLLWLYIWYLLIWLNFWVISVSIKGLWWTFTFVVLDTVLEITIIVAQKVELWSWSTSLAFMD